MPIDYLEYFSGQCFGAIGTNDEFVCDEQIGADIDAELDDHIDAELFGSANSKHKPKGLVIGRIQYKKLTDLFKKLRHKHRRGKSIIAKIKNAHKSSKANPKKSLMLKAKLTKDLEAVKSEMKSIAEKINAMWRTRRNKFKKKWAENHKNPHWKSPAAFIAKHGPHHLQVGAIAGSADLFGGVIVGNKNWRQLTSQMRKLKQAHNAAKSVIQKFNSLPATSPRKRILFAQVNKARNNMSNLQSQIVSSWNMSNNLFKNKWKSEHRLPAWKNPAAFAEKYGIHSVTFPR